MIEYKDLNEGQKQAVKKLIEWWKNGTDKKQVFEIVGPAGSGKTSVVHILINELGLQDTEVLFMALVGKAAMQMTRSGVCAQTIHSTIYEAYDKVLLDKDGEPIKKEGRLVRVLKFRKKTELSGNIKLLVVDEASMVSEKVGKDLMSFNIPIIALGDLYQLPPIMSDSFFLSNPDVTLTQIMRQAADNPIIALSQLFRGDSMPHLNFGRMGNKVFIMRKDDFLNHHMNIFLKADIVICGKNNTRDYLNNVIRKEYFLSQGKDIIGEITIGDKMICRENIWDVSVDNINLINGLLGKITDIDFETKTSTILPISFRPEWFTEDQEDFEMIKLNLEYFKATAQKRRELKSLSYHDGIFFEYGYAITCHLSQGSQYDNVIVFVEHLRSSSKEFCQWMYTAITRAANKLILLI